VYTLGLKFVGLDFGHFGGGVWKRKYKSASPCHCHSKPINRQSVPSHRFQHSSTILESREPDPATNWGDTLSADSLLTLRSVVLYDHQTGKNDIWVVNLIL